MPTCSYGPQGRWFHAPIPSPLIVGGVRADLVRVFVLLKCAPDAGSIRNVHVYDGSFRPQELNDVDLDGEHRTGVGGASTFDLDSPHGVAFGIGVTFCFRPRSGSTARSRPAQLIVAAVAYDVTAASRWVATNEVGRPPNHLVGHLRPIGSGTASSCRAR